MRDCPDPGRSGLSHFEGGFPKSLREWIPGFGGIKEGRQWGVALNPIGMNIVCFSRFFCACLCL